VFIKVVVRFVGALQIFGGTVCCIGLFLLYNNGGQEIVASGIVTNEQLQGLIIYYWISCAISFILALGLFKHKEWARKLSLLFISFGLLNGLIKIFPSLFVPVAAYVPSSNYLYLAVLKNIVIVLIDCGLLIFFMQPDVKKYFKEAS